MNNWKRKICLGYKYVSGTHFYLIQTLVWISLKKGFIDCCNFCKRILDKKFGNPLRLTNKDCIIRRGWRFIFGKLILIWYGLIICILVCIYFFDCFVSKHYIVIINVNICWNNTSTSFNSRNNFFDSLHCEWKCNNDLLT